MIRVRQRIDFRWDETGNDPQNVIFWQTSLHHCPRVISRAARTDFCTGGATWMRHGRNKDRIRYPYRHRPTAHELCEGEGLHVGFLNTQGWNWASTESRRVS